MLEAMGLIDSQQQKTFASYCARIVAAIKGKYMRLAFDIWDEMINGDVFPYGSLFLNVTGVYDYDNFENTRPPAAFALYSQVEAVVCAACVCPLLYACCDHTTTLTTRGRLPRVRDLPVPRPARHTRRAWCMRRAVWRQCLRRRRGACDRLHALNGARAADPHPALQGHDVLHRHACYVRMCVQWCPSCRRSSPAARTAIVSGLYTSVM